MILGLIADEAKEQYDINLVDLPDIKNQDAIIIAVEHDKYKILIKTILTAC